MNTDILVLRNRRTGGYSVKYVRLDKHGRALHGARECRTIDEAHAEAIDVNRTLFESRARIIGL